MYADLRALTLDLDDTLWPIWPTIERAEQRLHDWLAVNAPATAQRFDRVSLRALRDEVALEQPKLAHNFSAIRTESLRRALQQAGDDAGLANAAFDVFFVARHQVVLYDDVPQALQRLSQRYPLMAVTNGNADLARVGLGPWFRGSVTASGLGVPKPDARIFHHACELLGFAPAQVLHIGDDFDLDVTGALDAGLQAAWIRRGTGEASQSEGAEPVRHVEFVDLGALADALGC